MAVPKKIWQIALFYAAIAAITAALVLWLNGLASLVGTVKYKGHPMTIFALGILAYMFGLRHALDADHLAAIDNSTRKLVQEGKDARFTGLFFSLGHSTVVILLAVALMFSVRAVASAIPELENVGSVVGTLVSGGFLYIIGLLNFLVFFEIYEIFKRMRSGELDEAKLNELLLKRGFMGRYFGKLFKIVDKQWYLYPIGFLFGLGFDTASETALLAISAIASATIRMPIYMLLVFPFLFTAGMALVDATDGFFMSSAYGWAFSDPLRKVWYNLTTTIISVMVAWVVGTLELLGLIQSEFNLAGPFWDWIAAVNGDVWWGNIGIIIVSIFAVTWISSIIIYKFKVKQVAINIPKA
ncbi:putative high-affinity nickel-transport protein [Thermoproteus uzoniensis 768-20]|uniref:Nickel/cobalt efflux system n=1 Tax=Thermoproteus uzoniensis (strain 768-20) TaxID=999630 RepID=F2L629_THEU7|nr:HoxN/HupN/NixA family nickel/cobalt transporter [Thermoproteus uzoniensis]AEA13645.1 putative high-affinity nickel-transport protein [Thermoproteus uzoniensis 768-20]